MSDQHPDQTPKEAGGETPEGTASASTPFPSVQPGPQNPAQQTPPWAAPQQPSEYGSAPQSAAGEQEPYSEQSADRPQGGAYGAQQSPAYDQQPGYAQQPPVYGQQSPAYGQQQPPAYGQQQPPVYGQQPPAYGQQQPPVYGQQPPAYGQQPPAYGGEFRPYGLVGAASIPAGPDGKPPLWAPWYGIGLVDAFTRFWKKYVRFDGRASRGEYWWWALIEGVVLSVLSIIASIANVSATVGSYDPSTGAYTSGHVSVLWVILEIVIWLISVGTIVGGVALTIRRLHDANFSGWFWLLGFLPIVLIVLCALPSRPEGARFDRPEAPRQSYPAGA